MSKPRPSGVLGTLGVDLSDDVQLNLVAWLLDPRGWHGWDDLCLRTFADFANREFDGIRGRHFPTAGWRRATQHRHVRAGPGGIEILIRHPKGMNVGISVGEPAGLDLKGWRRYQGALARRSPLLMLYLKPWYQLEDYLRPPFSTPEPGPRAAGRGQVAFASCGRLYLDWVMKRASRAMASLRPPVHPAAKGLLDEFSTRLHDLAGKERHEDHAG